jgi:hypothetical protein
MGELDYAPVSDQEKIFYEAEAKFNEITPQHYRSLATIAATEIGFLIASMTLAGTNPDAKQFVTIHSPVLSLIAILFLVTIICGTLQGRWMNLAVLYSNRASFLPAYMHVELHKWRSRLTRKQATELECIGAKGHRKSKRLFKLFVTLNRIAGYAATTAFVGGNAIALWLIVKLTMD